MNKVQPYGRGDTHASHAFLQLGLHWVLQIQRTYRASSLRSASCIENNEAMHAQRQGDKQLKSSSSLLIIFCIFILGATNVYAGLPRDYHEWPNQEEDFAKLPPYCKVKLGKNVPEAEYKAWNTTFGRDFDHIHHYCSGLHVMNYYYRTSGAANKQKVLIKAIQQFSYMVDKAKPTWSLMPEIYANRGEAYLLAGNFVQGIEDLNKAISLNPSMLKPYVALADHYTRHKQPQNAMGVISEGLRYNPEHRGLQRRYLELGGQKPFPEPSAQTTTEETPPLEKQDSEPASQGDAVSGTTTQTQAAPATEPDTTQNTAPKIGAPGNPYCRFCPDPAPAEVPANGSVSPSTP